MNHHKQYTIILIFAFLFAHGGCIDVDDNTDTITPDMGTNMDMEADPHEMTTLDEMPSSGPMMGEAAKDVSAADE